MRVLRPLRIQQPRDQTGGRRRREREREQENTEEKNSRQLPQRDFAKIAGKDYKPLHQREPLGTQRDLSLLLHPPSLQPWTSWQDGRPALSSSPHPPPLYWRRPTEQKTTLQAHRTHSPNCNPANDIMGPLSAVPPAYRPTDLPGCGHNPTLHVFCTYICICTCAYSHRSCPALAALFHWQPKPSSGCSSCTYHAPQTRTTFVAKQITKPAFNSCTPTFVFMTPTIQVLLCCKPGLPSTVQALAPRAELLDVLRLCKYLPDCPWAPLPSCLCLPSMVAPLKPLKFGT